MKFTLVEGVWQHTTDTVVNMSTVTCLDKHGIWEFDKCSELTGLNDTLSTLVTNPHQYLQENDAIIVHSVHSVLQTTVDVLHEISNLF